MILLGFYLVYTIPEAIAAVRHKFVKDSLNVKAQYGSAKACQCYKYCDIYSPLLGAHLPDFLTGFTAFIRGATSAAIKALARTLGSVIPLRYRAPTAATAARRYDIAAA